MSTVEDVRRMAFDLYEKMIAIERDACGTYAFEQEQNLSEMQAKVELLLLQFLCFCLPQERFKYREFQNMIIQSSSMNGFEPIKAAEAFKNLEGYVVLLCVMPWKQEFRNIKKFNGFYQTKIESHLRNADTVFKLIGYSELKAGVLTLARKVHTDVLQSIAFECLIASQECYLLERVWKQIFDWGLSISQVVRYRQQFRGSDEELVEVLRQEKTNVNSADNVLDCRMLPPDLNRRSSAGVASTAPFRHKLENYAMMAKKHSNDTVEDIPFIDEGVKDSNFVPVNLDEQIMASLKMVEGQGNKFVESGTNLEQNVKPSQEWNFVREGLERSYGKQYFDGPRKDLLENQPVDRHIQRKEGPYVKVFAESPDPGYVNSDIANKQKKLQAKQLQQTAYMSSGMTGISESKDSAYGSAYQTASVTPSNTALFPPSIGSADDQMRKRGNGMPRQVTDTIITKGVKSERSHTGGFANTEPILRKTDAVAQKLYHTQTYPGYGQEKNLENIQRYKRASAPPLQKAEPFMQTRGKNMPLTGSYNDSAPTNTVDSAQPNRMVQNISVQNSHETPWACIHCTYLNNPMTDICDMCFKSRISQTEVDSPLFVGHSSRICDQCTLENEINSDTCHACGNQLRGLQTVI